MTNLKSVFSICLLLFSTIIFFQCKKDAVEEIAAQPSNLETYQFLAPNGQMITATVSGSTLSFEYEGQKHVYDLDEFAKTNSAVRERAPVNSVSGHLETEQFNRGKINIEYNGESGHVFWKRVDNSKVWGDIVCVNQVGDQTIVEFVITRVSTGFYSVGTHLTMTVRDLGNPGNGQPNDDWANVIWSNLPCDHFIIPLVNARFGYLESDGNIVVNY